MRSQRFVSWHEWWMRVSHDWLIWGLIGFIIGVVGSYIWLLS